MGLERKNKGSDRNLGSEVWLNKQERDGGNDEKIKKNKRSNRGNERKNRDMDNGVDKVG